MSRMNEDDNRKLFVGGLSWQTSNESLKEYFCKFGEVVDCKVMMNRITNKSRGFGFVTYKDEASVSNIETATVHELDGKRIDPKRCNQQAANLNQKIKSSPKVFVGGVPFSVGRDEMRNFFQQYGTVLDVNLMLGKDRDPTRHRGFGFVTFESQETVDRLLALRFVELQDRQVEIKKAEPQTPKPGGGQWGGQGPDGQWQQQQWGPPGGNWQQGQWGQQGQWPGQQGGWDQQQWGGYAPGYGYGYDQSWQQPGGGAPAGQWGAQGDASQAQQQQPPAGGAPPPGYPPQQAANGYGQQGYGQGYQQQYGQTPAAAGAAQPPAAAGGYGYDQSGAVPAAGAPAAPAAPAATGYPPPQQAAAPAGAPPTAAGYEGGPQQGYNRPQQGYHPYKR